MHKKIAFIADIATLVAMGLLVAFLIKGYAFPSRSRPSAGIKPGDTVALSSVDWKTNQRALVIVLQRGCHFCSESAPFYNRLVPAARGKNLRVIAGLPGTVVDSKDYLASVGVPIEEVLQIDLGTLHVRGTPTLLLVDAKGVVDKVWVGRLTPDKEKDVIASL